MRRRRVGRDRHGRGLGRGGGRGGEEEGRKEDRLEKQNGWM